MALVRVGSRITGIASVVLIGLSLQIRPSFAAESQISWFETRPQEYADPRGNEPLFQNVVQTVQSFSNLPAAGDDSAPWTLQLHFDAETLGRRDISFDLDRAWIREGNFTLGRIHPWEVSGNPEANRPWGYLAQYQAQNLGILLGSDYHDNNSVMGHGFPQPILLGWIGAQYWSDSEHRDALAFGISATPFFLPTMGSEVSLNGSDVSVGRFGRRPPGYVEVNGVQLPIRYQVDETRILQDIVLQPQVMGQARWDLGNVSSALQGHQGWLSISRAPRPDPVFDTSGVLQVSDTNVNALAYVKPQFPELWMGSVVEQWAPEFAPGHGALFGSALAREGGTYGFEIGEKSDYLDFSFADEFTSQGPSLGATTGPFTSELLQAEGRIPFATCAFYGGVKTQLDQGGFWYRSGLRDQFTKKARLELGFDVFSGNDKAYFGEWRTNSNVFLSLSWILGS